jgi:hypothetical protein
VILVSETCKELNKAMGIKGRFVLFGFGFIGLFFPGWVAYVVIAGMAKCTEDQDMYKFLKQFAE